jgi:hypothetical protein
MLFVSCLLIASALIGLFLTVENVTGADLYVGPGSTFDNIQDALNASTPGDIIHIANGNYTQNLTIHKGVSLRGNSTDKCNIKVSSGPAVIVDGSQPQIWLLNISTTNDDSDVIKCINGAYPSLVICTLNFTGANSYAINCDSSQASVSRCSLDNNKKAIKAVNDANLSIRDTTVLPGNVEVDATSFIEVRFSVTLTALYEDGMTPIEDADAYIAINGDPNNMWSYATEHYGMAGPKTDVTGSIYCQMVNATYDGSSTPIWGFNTVKVYKSFPYKSGILENEEVRNITRINNRTTVNVIFTKDIRAPDMIENVTVTTIDQTSLRIDWNATSEPGFVNYTVYSSDIAGIVTAVLTNTTDNWFVDTGLLPETQYFYVVTVWDTTMLESTDSDVANGTTMAIPTGLVQGTIDWEDKGMTDLIAAVKLKNLTATIATLPVNATNNTYAFTDIVLQTNLSVEVIPDLLTLGEINLTSGYFPKTSNEFELSLTVLTKTMDMTLEWYEFVPIVSGRVLFTGGPIDPRNASWVTIELIQYKEVFNATLNDNETVVSTIATTITNATTGMYTFDVMKGSDFGIRAVPDPDDSYDEAKGQSGYSSLETDKFNIVTHRTLDLNLTWREYIPEDPIVEGQVRYTGGPFDPRNATSVTVEIYQRLIHNGSGNDTQHRKLINSTETHFRTGEFKFQVPVNEFYFLKVVIPKNERYVGGEDGVGGYEDTEIDLGVLAGNAVVQKTINLTYIEWIETKYTLSGTVSYFDGPKAEEYAVGATVSTRSGSATVDVNGTYELFLERGTYEVTVTPAAEDLGEIDVRSGYLPHTRSIQVFSGQTYIVTLMYYDHEQSVLPYISITSPIDNTKFDPGEEITVSGTSDLEYGSIITVSLGDQTSAVMVDHNGGWSTTIIAPDEAGVYLLQASANGSSDQVTILVVDIDQPDVVFVGGLCIAFTVIVIILVIVIIIVITIIVLSSRGEKIEPVQEKEYYEDDEELDEEEYYEE